MAALSDLSRRHSFSGATTERWTAFLEQREREQGTESRSLHSRLLSDGEGDEALVVITVVKEKGVQ